MSNTLNISRRVLMRYLTSSSLLPGSEERWVMPNLEESNSPATFVNNMPKQEKSIDDGSIYDVENADDLLKKPSSPGGQPMDTAVLPYNNTQVVKPKVPQNVRR